MGRLSFFSPPSYGRIHECVCVWPEASKSWLVAASTSSFPSSSKFEAEKSPLIYSSKSCINCTSVQFSSSYRTSVKRGGGKWWKTVIQNYTRRYLSDATFTPSGRERIYCCIAIVYVPCSHRSFTLAVSAYSYLSRTLTLTNTRSLMYAYAPHPSSIIGWTVH